MDVTVLEGRRLLVPVTAQRRHLAQRLAAAGAVVEEAEFIEITTTSDADALESATLAWCAGDFDWLVVTSRNALAAMQAVALDRGVSLNSPQPQAQVAAVGAGTQAACEAAGLTVTLVPERRHNALGLVAAFPEGSGRVLAPLGNLASSVVEDGLSAKGWHVVGVEAYRTVDGAGIGRATREELGEGGFDAVILTSGSVATRFAAHAPVLPDHTLVIAIGDTTAAAARAAGVTVSAVADAPSYDGIVRSLIEVFDPSEAALEPNAGIDESPAPQDATELQAEPEMVHDTEIDDAVSQEVSDHDGPTQEETQEPAPQPEGSESPSEASPHEGHS